MVNANRHQQEKYMKHFFKVAIAAALGLALGSAVQAQSALNEILDSGVLKVGTTGDWNPMSLRDPATNSYKGYDIDIMNAMAADLGVEVEYVPTRLENSGQRGGRGQVPHHRIGLDFTATHESCRVL